MRRAASIALAATIAIVATVAAASVALHFANGGHARIPFVIQGGHIWVRGAVDHSDSLWIIVDTGAAGSVMDDALAKRLGLAQHGSHMSMGAGGMQRASSVSDVTIRLPGLDIHRDHMDTIDLAALGMASSHPMDVILGYEFFASGMVRFDYGAGMIDVWDADHAPKDLPGVEVPMTLIDNHPYIEATLDLPGRAPLRGRFVLDSGSGGGVIVAPDVAERESLATAFPRTLKAMARGVGGERSNTIGRGTALSIGDQRIDRPMVAIPASARGHISHAGTLGNIGGQLLGRCRVTFDYPHQRIRFERAPDFDQPFEADMSGISFSRDTSGWVVRFVNPDTPASEAGVRAGDVMVALDGQSASHLDPTSLQRIMRTEGRSVRLDLRRGDQTSAVTLTLRRLL
jgi:hypothetical protein